MELKDFLIGKVEQAERELFDFLIHIVELLEPAEAPDYSNLVGNKEVTGKAFSRKILLQ